jgi:putative spermidine/putrescine transport system permease protein
MSAARSLMTSDAGPWTRLAARVRGAVPFAPALFFLCLVFFVPIVMLLARSVTASDGQWTGVHFRRLFETSAYVNSLWLTVKISTWTALLSVTIAYPLARWIATARKSLGTTLLLSVLVPYWAGVLVRSFAWMVLLSRNGPANGILKALGLTDKPLALIYNFAGVMVGMINAYMPLAVLVMVSAMQAIDLRLMSAATTMGAGRGQAFWRVYFPLSMPGVVSALLLIFIASIGTFITPALLGSGNEVMIAQVMIDQVEQLLNWGFAGAVGVLILVATLLMFFIFSQLFGTNALMGRAASGPPTGMTRLVAIVGRRILGGLGGATDFIGRFIPGSGGAVGRLSIAPSLGMKLVAALVLLFLITPALFLIPVSFTGGGFIEWPPKGFSLRWYDTVLGSPSWLRAALRSAYVGVLAATVSVALALPVAIALTRRRVAGQRMIMAVMLAPMIIPHILLALALLLVFAPLGLVGSDLGLVLGHAVVCLPYTLVTLLAVLSTYDQRLDQAASTMGAGTLQRLWRITLPLIRPGLIAALLIAFITSFEELTIAMFVTGGLSATLPKQLWGEMLMAVSPALAAVSTLMLLFVMTVVAIIQLVQGRAARKAAR